MVCMNIVYCVSISQQDDGLIGSIPLEPHLDVRLVRDPKALSVSSSINLITDNYYNILAHHALGWFFKSMYCVLSDHNNNYYCTCMSK